MRKVALSLAAVLLVVFVSFVSGSLSTDKSSLNFGGSSKNPGDPAGPISFTLQETANVDLTSLALQFSKDSQFDHVSFLASDITGLPSSISANSTLPITLDFVIPQGFHAFDQSSEQESEFKFGDLTITGQDANGTSFTTSNIVVNLEVANNLKIGGVKIQSDEGTDSVTDGSTKSVEADQTITLKVSVRNDFSDTLGINFNDGDVNVEVSVEDITDSENEEQNSDEVTASGDEVDVEVSFDLEEDDDGDHDVEILVLGTDEHGGIHGDTFSFVLDVQEPSTSDESDTSSDDTTESDSEDVPDSDGDGVSDLDDFCPTTLFTCTVDENGCPTECPKGSDGCIDDNNNGLCDRVEDEEGTNDVRGDNLRAQQNEPEEDEDVEKEKKEPKESTGGTGFVPFLVGFIVGVIVTFCFMLLTRID